MQKLFSVITPTYNSGSKLETTIQSVLAQDSSLFEYIIVDGGSTDNTLSLIEKYRDQLKFKTEPDEGVYDAMNKGIDMASGKYLMFLGAGDRLRANVLRQISEELPGGPLNFVYGNVFWVKEGTTYGWEFSERDLIHHKNICHQAIFYERKIFDLLGGYETRYKTLADFALNLKCFGNRSITRKYINRVIADYEGGGVSQSESDPVFMHDFNRLIFTRLGFKPWLKYVLAPRIAASFHYRIVRPLTSGRRSENRSNEATLSGLRNGKRD